MGAIIPKIKRGIPTHNVQALNECPPIAGINHPMIIGKQKPTNNPNSFNCLTETTLFIINQVQILVSNSHFARF